MHGDVWLYAPPAAWDDNEVVLGPDESHHATRVLRAEPPDVVTITDGNGLLARCALARNEGGRVVAEILERRRDPAPVPRVAVYQGAAKGQKNDAVVERLAELGVADLVTFTSRRSVVRWDEGKQARLRERWDAIAIGAAKQSKNPFTMNTRGVITWNEMLRSVESEPLAVALWEGAELPMRTALVHDARRIALVVGPEGGYEREEAEALADAGAQLVSLGPRILRTENAAASAAAAVMYHYGTFG